MVYSQWEIHRTAIGNQRITVILCDDDSHFLKALQGELARIFTRLKINTDVHTFNRPADIRPELLASCSLAFLDIDFDREDQNGIDIARSLRQRNDHALIFFVTNYIDYAPAGYEVQAFRYILKRDMGEVLERYMLQAMEAIAEEQEHLQLRAQDQTAIIPLEQITYLEVLDHYISIHTDSDSFTLHATLSAMESEMEAHGFLRIHKSFLVNMRCIRKFRSRECLLLDGTALAVSEKYYSQQKQKYLLWKGLK